MRLRRNFGLLYKGLKLLKVSESPMSLFEVERLSSMLMIVYLKISPMKGAMWFWKKGKFSPHKILRWIGKVSYELELPNDFALGHPVFHVSFLNKCVGDPTSIVFVEGLGVNEDFLMRKF